MIHTVTATRYVTPLREGGSLPAIIEADDAGLYVVKFRGAGQGAKALTAELIAGELARALDLMLPRIVLVDLDASLARTEPDPEIQQLIRESAGLNAGLDYLPGSVTFDPVVDRPDPIDASRIVWFDAFVSNVDRTPRNANLLTWHRELWLIDHGAALYFHHGWKADSDLGRERFAAVSDHILLPWASGLAQVDEALAAKLTPEVIGGILASVPEEWLAADRAFADTRAVRSAYLRHFTRRLEAPRPFLEDAIRAHRERV